MLTHVLAPHEDTALIKPKQLLDPLGITHFYTDGRGAYLRLLEQQHHTVGKANTQVYRAQAFNV